MDNSLWEKIVSLAPAVGVTPGAANVWKHRGYVPPKWHWPLCEAAKKRKIKLKMEDFVSPSTQEAAQ